MEIRNLQASNVFEWLTQTKKRINFLIGGRNSTKSWSIALHLLINKFFGEENKRILIIRKTRVSVRKSCFQLILDFLRKYDCYKYVNVNRTELEITRKDNSGNSILFTGLDDVDKLKSLEQGNYIWIEEAIDIFFREFINLDILMRRETDSINQMFLSTNPMSALSWIKTKIVDKPDQDTAVHISTVDDNPFASDIDKQRLDRLKDEDLNLYKIYRLSQWGILENIIYEKWKPYPEVDKEKVKEITYGIDWGYSSPATLIKVYWFNDDKVIAEELIYQTGLTTEDLLSRVKVLIKPEHRQREIYAGTDEPGSIETFFQAGFNIHKAVTDVRDGINWCKAHLVGFIGENLIKEAQGYKRKEDKDGNVLEEPVKFMDHALDAFRYGAYSAARHYQSADTLISSFR